MPSAPSRRRVITAGLGLLAVAVAGCTKVVQARVQPATGSATPPTQTSTVTLSSPTAATARASAANAPPASIPARTSRPPTRQTLASTPRSTSPAEHTAADTTTTRPSGPARQVAAGPGDRPRVALTFHGAGDISYARQILQIARLQKVHITVMAVGTWLADNPQIGREILAAGHDVGNHTLSHVDINSLTKDQMRTEVIGCRDILRRTTGTPGSYFRQSQSPTANGQLLAVAGQAGYQVCLSYNLDSMDWTDPGAQAVRDNVAAAGPGAIVSMHLGHSGTVTALPGILDDLGKRGLSAVTVTMLLSP